MNLSKYGSVEARSFFLVGERLIPIKLARFCYTLHIMLGFEDLVMFISALQISYLASFN